MRIDSFIKENKDLVVEIDEVDYLVDSSAVEEIRRGEERAELIRLFDGKKFLVRVDSIMDAVSGGGATDYLDKKAV